MKFYRSVNFLAFNVPLTLACAAILAPVTPVSCMMRIKPRFYSTSGDNNFSNNSNSNSKTEIFILSSIYEGEKFMSELKTKFEVKGFNPSFLIEIKILNVAIHTRFPLSLSPPPPSRSLMPLIFIVCVLKELAPSLEKGGNSKAVNNNLRCQLKVVSDTL